MEKKLWGLFTGGQLTIVATAALLCFAVPGGLWAAGKIQFSYASIYDPGSKQRAKIGAGGALKVTNGIGPLNVSGNVTAALAAPANFVHYRGFSANGCQRLIAVPATSAVIVTRMLVAPTSGASATAYLQLYASEADCNNTTSDLAYVSALANDTREYDFTPGLALPAGGSLWVGTPSLITVITLTGYLVPAAAVPAATVTAQRK